MSTNVQESNGEDRDEDNCKDLWPSGQKALLQGSRVARGAREQVRVSKTFYVELLNSP